MKRFESKNVELVESINLPAKAGDNCRFYLFKRFNEYISVLVKGELSNEKSKEGDDNHVLCRIHSECMFGDIFGSQRCDCGEQLKIAKEMIAEEDTGILFYLAQEGRGIGLKNKVLAYKLQQEKGYDTIEANMELGYSPDLRDYSAVAVILKDFFKISAVKLLTNNMKKSKPLRDAGIHVIQMPLTIEPNKHNKKYLDTKKARMGHTL